ncbi:MAG: hypothetical protein RJB66_1105 [Pseudomonadota bacterium]|jgi:hypothetical protein
MSQSPFSQRLKFASIIGVIILSSLNSFAFVEQNMSFSEKYQTSIGIFSAAGTFEETSEEPSMSSNGVGLFGDIYLRRSPWALRFDTYSTERATGNEGLNVTNRYTEFKVWGLGFVDLTENYVVYGGVGTGWLLPESTMGVLGSSKTMVGKNNALGGYLIGMRLKGVLNLFVDIWSQTVYVPVYPNGMLGSVAVALGYQF